MSGTLQIAAVLAAAVHFGADLAIHGRETDSIFDDAAEFAMRSEDINRSLIARFGPRSSDALKVAYTNAVLAGFLAFHAERRSRR